MTEKELANWEEELQGYAREILERERALQAAEHEKAETENVNRMDYLFDQVNRKQHRMVLETPQVIQIAPQERRPDTLTAIMAALAAVASMLTLVLPALR